MSGSSRSGRSPSSTLAVGLPDRHTSRQPADRRSVNLSASPDRTPAWRGNGLALSNYLAFAVGQELQPQSPWTACRPPAACAHGPCRGRHVQAILAVTIDSTANDQYARGHRAALNYRIRHKNLDLDGSSGPLAEATAQSSISRRTDFHGQCAGFAVPPSPGTVALSDGLTSGRQSARRRWPRRRPRGLNGG
jgi:hypothetical protein